MSTTRQKIIFAMIYQVVSAERRPATLRDLKQRTGHYRDVLTRELRALIQQGKVRKLTMSVSEDNFRYSYIPTSPLLSNGVGLCETKGCEREPEIIVAGHALCSQCARGPVERGRGGGVFASMADEDRKMRDLGADRFSSSQCAGGWSPDDGDIDRLKM